MADNTFEEILESISKNPNIVEKISEISKSSNKDNIYDSLPKIMYILSPLLSSEETKESNEKATTPLPKSEADSLSVPLARLGEKITKNSGLLLALKPYLNKERGEIIDTVVKIAQLGDLMKLIK